MATVLAILAVYRVARMLAMEEGAFSIFAKVRERFDPKQETWIGRGLNCPLCLGFWIAFVVACLLPFETWQGFILNWLGIAGGAVILHLWIEAQ